MNDEINQRIVSYLDAIESTASTAGEFVAEQTPLVAQEYLAWYFYSSLMASAFCLVVMLVTAYAIKKVYRLLVPKGGDLSQHPEVTLLLFPAILLVLSCFFAVYNASYAVKVCVAPRIVLLEKAAELAK